MVYQGSGPGLAEIAPFLVTRPAEKDAFVFATPAGDRAGASQSLDTAGRI
jgi:hypothetical protein